MKKLNDEQFFKKFLEDNSHLYHIEKQDEQLYYKPFQPERLSEKTPEDQDEIL